MTEQRFENVVAWKEKTNWEPLCIAFLLLFAFFVIFLGVMDFCSLEEFTLEANLITIGLFVIAITILLLIIPNLPSDRKVYWRKVRK